MCMLNVKRTIHTVGQGAFYSERFYNPQSQNNGLVVFDCGSFPKSKVISTVKSDLPSSEDIDILFISHFDSDHTNGIKALIDDNRKIKRVVVPQYEKYEWFYILLDAFRNARSKADANLIEKFKAAVGDAKIIQVRPLYDSEEFQAPDDVIEVRNIDNITNDHIDTGTSFTFRELQPIWMYQPINTTEKSKVDKLKAMLEPIFNENKVPNFDISKLDTTYLVRIITEHRAEINNIYKNVFGTSNAGSMCLYSGMINNNTYISLLEGLKCCKYIKHKCFLHCCQCFSYKDENSEACLYTGDANLVDKNMIKCISRIISDRRKRIGIMQVPHHGSKNNLDIHEIWNEKIRPERCFVSYGTNNNYGHPSVFILNEIINTGSLFIFEVTEKKDSRYSEEFVVFKHN